MRKFSSLELIKDALSAATTPQTIEQLVLKTSLHSNSVRNQLHILIEAGTARRVSIKGEMHSRKRYGYTLDKTGTSNQSLAEKLVGELLGNVEVDAIEETARRWASLVSTHQMAENPDQATESLASALTDLGFKAEVTGIGDTVVMRNCPHAKAVAKNPIICQIHAKLISHLIEQSSQDLTMKRIQIYPRPNVCLIEFHRPDLIPKSEIFFNPPQTTLIESDNS